ncbi:MAG TPA: methylated-DNA--[protein]-cysteine S-methyltransferase [Candidatus Binatia bacterium]|nr:methylated-DNA--[protein]-cysteine S-methyltransferase [Candidatus Binatia bacterium]
MNSQYYAVKTTGIYCRSGCKSRAPLPKNVEPFETPQAARAAGYRACKRCRPDDVRPEIDERFLAIARAIEAAEEPPTLRELSALVHMSEAHLQRSFKKAVGVSPRAYAAMVRNNRLRSGLRNGRSVTDAAYEAGFTSASQVYEGPAQRLGMRPSQFRAGGENAEIVYAIVPSALGEVLVAATERGICRVDIDADRDVLERRLRTEFPKARLRREDDRLESTTSLIVNYLAGEGSWPYLPIDVRATAFQMRVWEALRAIVPGKTLTYTELASAIGSPRAARAVARACATNPIALLVPCHRIVPSAGGVGSYRWDTTRKRRLLELERTG